MTPLRGEFIPHGVVTGEGSAGRVPDTDEPKIVDDGERPRSDSSGNCEGFISVLISQERTRNTPRQTWTFLVDSECRCDVLFRCFVIPLAGD